MGFSKYLLISLLVFPALLGAQSAKATLSGMVKDAATKSPLSFVTVMFKSAKDSSLISGSISNEEGRFSATDLSSGTYILELSLVGYRHMVQNIEVGKLSSFLDLGIIELQAEAIQLGEVVVSGQQDEVSSRMDKKTFSLADNLSLSGGSVLQTMQNLPGITTDNDGEVSAGPLHISVRVWNTVEWGAVFITLAALGFSFRLKWDMLRTIGVCIVLGLIFKFFIL